jgi:hypothetical protein
MANSFLLIAETFVLAALMQQHVSCARPQERLVEQWYLLAQNESAAHSKPKFTRRKSQISRLHCGTFFELN